MIPDRSSLFGPLGVIGPGTRERGSYDRSIDAIVLPPLVWNFLAGSVAQLHNLPRS